MSRVVNIKLTKNEVFLFQKFAELNDLQLEKAMEDAYFEKMTNISKNVIQNND